MSITRHEIPLLEFDSDKRSVIMPDHGGFDMELPKKAVFPFLGETVYKYAKRHNGTKVGEYSTVSKEYPVYVIEYRGERVCLCEAPVGGATATAFLDWLIGYGVREIISAGSCGVLCDIPEGTFLVPVRALRDEGTSYHYAPPSRYIELDSRGAAAVKAAFADHSLKYREVTTWTTDGFFRETAEKVRYRRDEGCTTVEMECASLAACAAFRGATFGMVLFSADSLADVDRHDARGWGEDSHDFALRLCLDAVIKM